MVGVVEEVLVGQHITGEFLHGCCVKNIDVVFVQVRTLSISTEVLETDFSQFFLELWKLRVVNLLEGGNTVVWFFKWFVRFVECVVMVNVGWTAVLCQEGVDKSREEQGFVHPFNNIPWTLDLIYFSHFHIQHVIKHLKPNYHNDQHQRQDNEQLIRWSQFDWEFLSLQLLIILFTFIHVCPHCVSARHVPDKFSSCAFTCG